MDEWDPDKEADPEKMQREFLAFGKEVIETLKSEQKKKAKVESLNDAIASCPPVAIGGYRPPTFSEVSAGLKRAWEETKKIAGDAPDLVKVEVLRTLMHCAPDDGQLI